MYQFVLGSGIFPPFTLCVAHPHEVLPLSTSSIQQYSDVLLHVCQEVNSDHNLGELELFKDQIVSA